MCQPTPAIAPSSPDLALPLACVTPPSQVAEQGTHVELLALRGIYYRLVKRQEQGLTVADRDLSPYAREPPNMSSFEEYESLRTATSSSLLNASVSLSSVSDAQMPPGEPMVVHGASSSGSSGGGVRALSPSLYPSTPASPSQQQPQQDSSPAEQQQQAPQQQQQTAEGALAEPRGEVQSSAQQVPIVAQQLVRATAVTSSTTAAVSALTAGTISSSSSSRGASPVGLAEPLLTQQRGRTLTRSSRWGTQRPSTPAGNTPGGVAAAAAAAAAGAGTAASVASNGGGVAQEVGSGVSMVMAAPSGTSSATAAARSPSPARLTLQQQQQQQQAAGSSLGHAALLSPSTNAPAGATSGLTPVTVGAVTPGDASGQSLQNDIVPVPKGMVGTATSSSSSSSSSNAGGAGPGAPAAVPAGVVVELPVAGCRGAAASSGSSGTSGAQAEVVAQ
jgi:hypothetical protein